MSGAAELLCELTAHGVALRVSGDRLRYTGPSAVVTPEVVEELRSHKPALIELLASESAPSPSPRCRCGRPSVFDVDGRALCVTCDGLPAGFGVGTHGHEPSASARAEVARVAPSARRLGWQDADLWQTAGWIHVRGLVAFVQPGDRVMLVTERSAHIRRGDGRLTFTRPESAANR